jgi:hypothetical protein
MAAVDDEAEPAGLARRGELYKVKLKTAGCEDCSFGRVAGSSLLNRQGTPVTVKTSALLLLVSGSQECRPETASAMSRSF